MGSPKEKEDRNGEDEDQHEVEITRPFFMGAYEVTQEEYVKVMGKNPSYFSAEGEGKKKVKGLNTDRFPVEQVSWEDAREFCKKLSDRVEEKQAGRVYRLPTEAEWEYACRGGAGDATHFHVGQTLSSPQANFDGTRPYQADEGPNLGRTAAVGSYKPNAFGLSDMHGNVAEWCADSYLKDYYRKSPGKDPPGPKGGDLRVYRGGSWLDDGKDCRSAARNSSLPTFKGSAYGFRVVLVIRASAVGTPRTRTSDACG
jgi:formylglycine-generating enzyme required for sulfatase activity